MTKPPKVPFYITTTISQDSCSSHIPHSPSGSSFPLVLLFLANTTPNKNWSEGRDFHQCLPQRIESKDYMEKKWTWIESISQKIYFRQKINFASKNQTGMKNWDLFFYMLPNLWLVAKCNPKTSLLVSFSTLLFLVVFFLIYHSENFYSFFCDDQHLHWCIFNIYHGSYLVTFFNLAEMKIYWMTWKLV